MKRLVFLVLAMAVLISCEKEDCPTVETEVVYFDELQVMNEVLIGMPEMEMREIYHKKGVTGSITGTPDDVYLTYKVGARWIDTEDGYMLMNVTHKIHVTPSDRKVYLIEVIYEE